jgi:hypothetical protein
VPAHRARWLELVVDDTGKVDWLGYQMLTGRMSINAREFLELEEVSRVRNDRRLAWESWLKKHPKFFEEV